MKKISSLILLTFLSSNAHATKVFNDIILPIGAGAAGAAIFYGITTSDDDSDYDRAVYEQQRRRERQILEQQRYERQRLWRERRAYEEQREYEKDEVDRQHLKQCRWLLRTHQHEEFDYRCR